MLSNRYQGVWGGGLSRLVEVTFYGLQRHGLEKTYMCKGGHPKGSMNPKLFKSKRLKRKRARTRAPTLKRM